MSSGLSGVALMRAPKGASTSSTAAVRAAAGASVPPSPTPLTQSGLIGLGVTQWAIRMAGTWTADGMT